MSEATPIVIADSCIGGMSVLKSLWSEGFANNAMFLADYASNPLGVKSDADIAEVAARWLTYAAARSETLIIACNTLSVRYQGLRLESSSLPSVSRVVSMVDCFDAMARAESNRLRGNKVLILGTEYTASQSIYADILRKNRVTTDISAVAATELERQVARFLPWSDDALSTPVKEALGNTDFAILACTCFPIVIEKLKTLFPTVTFLDPGVYCAMLMDDVTNEEESRLTLDVTGHAVQPAEARRFAGHYLMCEQIVDPITAD